MNQYREDLISNVHSLQDLSIGTLSFDLLSLNSKVNLLFKNFNLGHNFWIREDRAFIFHCVFHETRPFHGYQHFDITTLTLKCAYFSNNLYLGHTFWTRRGIVILQTFPPEDLQWCWKIIADLPPLQTFPLYHFNHYRFYLCIFILHICTCRSFMEKLKT